MIKHTHCMFVNIYKGSALNFATLCILKFSLPVICRIRLEKEKNLQCH